MVRQVVIPKSFLALHHDVHIFSPTCAATVPDCLDRARPVIEKARVLLPGHRHCYGSICAGAHWVVACPAVVVAVSVCDVVGGDGNYLAHSFRRAGKTGFLRRCLLLSVAAAWRGQRTY